LASPAEVPFSRPIKHLALANCLSGALIDKSFSPNPLIREPLKHPAIAELVNRRPDVVGVGDSLFGPDLSQTSRYVDPNPNQGV
jgi:hypothetical protein